MAQSFHALSECTALPRSLCVDLLGFYEASWHMHDWLIHWPLVIDSTSSFSSNCRGHREGTESSNPLITWLGPLAISPHHYMLSKSQLNITKDLCCSHHLGNFKGFWSSDPEMGQRPNIHLLEIIISQSLSHYLVWFSSFCNIFLFLCLFIIFSQSLHCNLHEQTRTLFIWKHQYTVNIYQRTARLSI